jgi:glycosyltransferase involved in cell wall biosynthesis
VPALRAVAPELELTAFVSADAPEDVVADPRSRGVDWARLPTSSSSRTHLVAQMAALPVLARRRRLDLLHSLANIGPLAAPGVVRVVTLLDVIWLHQRDQWERGRAARGFALLSRFCAHRADRVITISHSARDDIVASLDLAADRVDVAPLGVRVDPSIQPPSEREVRASLQLDGPVVLSVAQKRPYKNLGSLIRAVAGLEERATLVLVGAPTAHENELRALASQLGVDDRVRFPGWLSEPELEGLYRVASCFVLPSLIEGFGLPVLEAMARGVPVACSDRPALPEVVGEAALLFDPQNQEAVRAAIKRVLADRAFAQTLVERGRERVRSFTWERTAEATLASYRKALAPRGITPTPV